MKFTSRATPRLTLKAAVSAGLTVALLGTAVGCTVTSGYDNQPVYRDGSFNRASQQLRQDLRRSGYDVINIKSDEYRGRQILIAYAKKNNQLYELKYTYPELKRISSVKKSGENIWQDNNDYRQKNHKNNGNSKYKNNGNYKNNSERKKKGHDVEDRIKQEARYPAIKQRAIRKVNAMGYRVTDIELDEKKNRAFFDIEAKRGGQDYEIELSYPDLNVIKLKKD